MLAEAQGSHLVPNDDALLRGLVQFCQVETCKWSSAGEEVGADVVYIAQLTFPMTEDLAGLNDGVGRPSTLVWLVCIWRQWWRDQL